MVASSDTIEVLYLNGTKSSTLGFVRGTGIQTLDFIYNMNTVCWIESRESSSQLKCVETSKTGMLTDEWIISTIPYLHSKYFKFEKVTSSKMIRRASVFSANFLTDLMLLYKRYLEWHLTVVIRGDKAI